MTLTLVRLTPDAEHFASWAARRDYLPARSDDLGYALHAGLKAAFGDFAPRPFYWREGRSGAQLYGYSAADPASLIEAGAMPGLDPELHAALNIASLEARAMPTVWRAGQVLSFECRVRPVVRQNRVGERDRFKEVDAAAHAAATCAEAARVPTKTEAYRNWTASRLSGAAEIVEADIVSLKRTRCLRRPHTEQGRRPKVIEGPDVTLKGALRITDAEAFAARLARGVGRHCAFGFGMLLLAPPGAL